MLGRRKIDTPAQFRSSLSDAAFAVEERLVWGGIDVLRGVAEVVKWPFERAVWAVERGLVWPLEERTSNWSGPIRTAGVAALALFAIGAGVLGLVWASGSGGTAAPPQQALTPIVPHVVTQAPEEKPAQSEPVLQGAAPDFTPKGADAGSKAKAETTTKSSGETSAAAADTSSTTPPFRDSSAAAEPAGPAATKVAHQFAGAFVLYETGRDDAKVRAAFAATAAPQLARSLLQRPPRLPANVKVPKAKVLNIVPGPRQAGTYTLSVSLLRLGVTSELRLDMQRDQKTDEWQVTDVRG